MQRVREDNPRQITGRMLTDARLRDAVVALVAARTGRPFAAVYPVAQGVLAVNDGAWIQTHQCEPLYRDVAAALVSGGGSPEVTWLLVDVDKPALRVVGVRAAIEYLSSSLPRTASVPPPRRDVGPLRGGTTTIIASRRRDDGTPGRG